LIILEHELNNDTVGAFINAYPNMKAKGWNTVSVARLVASGVDKVTGKAYWNADNGNDGTPTSMGLLDKGLIGGGGGASGASTPTTGSSKTPTPSGANLPAGAQSPAPTLSNTQSGASRFVAFTSALSVFGIMWAAWLLV
jgi:chitin deacetylase